MRRQAAVLLALAAATHVGCRSTKSQNDMSDIKFAQGGPGFTHGHEALIYIGTVRAHEVIGDGYYDMKDMDDSAGVSQNPMLWGSLTADFPSQARGFFDRFKAVQEDYCRHFGYDATIKAQRKVCEDMPYAGIWQTNHFLRNWSADNTLAGDRTTCQASQEAVVTATARAIELRGQAFNGSANFWRDYWAGVGAHTIQDSFSEAHVIRTGADRRTLEQICHYNKDVVAANPNVCAHRTPVDSRDVIWASVPPAFEARAFDFMTPAGQFASLATKAYLVHLAQTIENLPSGLSGQALVQHVRERFQPYFNDGSLGEGYGYMNCTTLSD